MKSYLFILFFVVPFLCISQYITPLYKWKLNDVKHLNEKDISSWNVDLYDNIYIAKESTIFKINSKGDTLFSQSIKSIGEISKIDILNPMKISIFSFDYQSNCFLDNTLTVVDKCIDLTKLDLQMTNNICISNKRNRAWIWDSNNSKLVQITMTPPISIHSSSNNLLDIIKVGNPVFIEEIENNLYLFDNKNTLYIFDLFGTLIHQINDFPKKTFLAKNNTKLWSIHKNDFDDNVLYCFQDDFSKIELAKIPLKNIINFRLSENYIYIQTNNGIYVYSIDKKKQ